MSDYSIFEKMDQSFRKYITDSARRKRANTERRNVSMRTFTPNKRGPLRANPLIPTRTGKLDNRRTIG